MFKLAKLPTFQRTVTMRVPSETTVDGFDEQSLKVTFRAIDEEEARKLDEQWLQLPDKERIKNRHYFLKAVVIDWAEVVDADKNDVPFSAAALDQALSIQWFAPAVGDAYRKAMMGDAARLGN